MGGEYAFHSIAGGSKALKNSIFVCPSPIEEFWQLGRLSGIGENFALIGWRVYPRPLDGGMPESVGEIMARTMTAAANVIFLSSDVESSHLTNEWKNIGEDAVCVLSEPNSLKSFLAALSNRTTDLVLLSTQNPEKVVRLFDEGIYSWSMQAQVVFLAEPGRALPEIERQTLLSLFQNDWLRYSSGLKDEGVKCVLRPGVDGDVAGILFLTNAFRHTFLEILENQSRAAGFNWEVLSEADFASSLADSHK